MTTRHRRRNPGIDGLALLLGALGGVVLFNLAYNRRFGPTAQALAASINQTLTSPPAAGPATWNLPIPSGTLR